MLEGIMTNDEFQDFLKAAENSKDYTFNKNGLNIKLNNTDNGFECYMTYTEPTKKVVDEFTEYCESFNDEVFVGVCEFIGKEGLSRINDCLDSNDIDSVRSGIQYFKNKAREYVSNKITEYKHIYLSI